MRRHKNLYSRIISFQNLLKAARLAERYKRFKYATARFNFFLEKELWQLHHKLESKTYEPGGYHHFLIFEPKKRVISAAIGSAFKKKSRWCRRSSIRQRGRTGLGWG